MQNPQIQITLKPSIILLTIWCITSFLLLLIIWTLPRWWGYQVVASIVMILPCLWAIYNFKQQQKKPIKLAWQDQVFYCKKYNKRNEGEWCEFEPEDINVRLWLIKFNCKLKILPSILSSLFSSTITILSDQLSEKDHRIWRLLLRFNHLN